MQDYSMVQGQTVMELLVALLSFFIGSYAFWSWRARVRSMAEPEVMLTADNSNMLPPETAPLNANLRSPSSTRRNASPASGQSRSKAHRSSIGDWLAPILVWLVVGWSVLAVAAILLGEK